MIYVFFGFLNFVGGVIIDVNFFNYVFFWVWLVIFYFVFGFFFLVGYFWYVGCVWVVVVGFEKGIDWEMEFMLFMFDFDQIEIFLIL